jgi:protein-tyrosine phosphatase
MNASRLPRRVLAVCLGNICRSPTIEAVLRRKAEEAGLDLHVDSAGTAGYHVGSAPDPRAIRHGARREYELGDLRARRVQGSDFEEFDLILAADEANLRDLKERCPVGQQEKLQLFLGDRPLPDPYYGEGADFERVLDLVEERVEKLLAIWARGSSC